MCLPAPAASLMVLPVTIAATTGVAPGDAGLASGLLNMGRQIGGALGLAALVTIAASVTTGSGNHPHARPWIRGYDVALLIAAGVSLLAGVTALFLQPGPTALPAPQIEEAEDRAETEV